MTQPLRRPHEVQDLTTAIVVCATALCALGLTVAEWRAYATLAGYVGRHGVALGGLLSADDIAGSLGTVTFVGTLATAVMVVLWTWRVRVDRRLARAARHEWSLLLGAWLVIVLTHNTVMDGTLGPVLTETVGLTVGGVLLAVAAGRFVFALWRDH
ncbi:hypothetical protein [Labedaea rhizosphaerae]|uniref:Uncharacterized protein n=1 Tax=Labedaea rhizosphaerae TaxID=598644 RepID=A0A4R6SQT5_LABRH|nr:hypothetical protein [Labedaea rhizosphaerae]TDQ05643.1 hypothetical protein EV186_1011617 [Labedaea rhizosphaerae]